MTGAASVGARESSFTVGYEEGSGYVVVGFWSGALLALELDALPLFELEALFALELEVLLALELEVLLALGLEVRLAPELEVLPALELDDGRVEDACVEEDLAVLEKPAGSVTPLFLAHVPGSTSLGQHRPLMRQ